MDWSLLYDAQSITLDQFYLHADWCRLNENLRKQLKAKSFTDKTQATHDAWIDQEKLTHTLYCKHHTLRAKIQ